MGGWRFRSRCVRGIGAGCSIQARPSSGAGDRVCTVTKSLTALSALPEASGVTLSRGTPGVLWAHNDGEPVLVALDGNGTALGTVAVEGVELQDWEAIAAGACPQGSCLYLADIGDNNRSRAQIRIYRIPEPQPLDATTGLAESWVGVYPDGPHDAEALLVSRVTDASTAGEWVSLRTNDELLFYRLDDLLSGAPPQHRVDLRGVREAQGEGVALTSEGIVYLVGEGGSGTLASLSCSLR